MVYLVCKLPGGCGFGLKNNNKRLCLAITESIAAIMINIKQRKSIFKSFTFCYIPEVTEEERFTGKSKGKL